MYHASKRLKSQESWQFRKSVHATFPTVTLYWGSKGWIPKSPMQLSIEERNCWETFCVSRLVEQYVLARRDKRFLILFSEGLTREARHHFRCMKHVANLWNTYGDALFTLEIFINSYVFQKTIHFGLFFLMRLTIGRRHDPIFKPVLRWTGCSAEDSAKC